MVPSPTALTFKPVLPRVRYFIAPTIGQLDRVAQVPESARQPAPAGNFFEAKIVG
jgi:hypothetical protein